MYILLEEPNGLYDLVLMGLDSMLENLPSSVSLRESYHICWAMRFSS